MGEYLRFGRGGAGDGPVADEDSFAHAQKHELYDFHQMVVGELAFGEIREQVGDVLRAVNIRKQAFVIGGEIAIVVGFGDPARVDVVHGGVSADLSDSGSMDAT